MIFSTHAEEVKKLQVGDRIVFTRTRSPLFSEKDRGTILPTGNNDGVADNSGAYWVSNDETDGKFWSYSGDFMPLEEFLEAEKLVLL